MGDPVWENGNQKALAALCEAERRAANEPAVDVAAFERLYGALTSSGPLNVDSLLSVARKHNISATREQVVAIFKQYDANFDSQLQIREFAQWWAGANDGLSVLLRNALSEAILQPGQAEQWKRGNQLRFDVTAGKVDDSFEPKSGIYVTVVPSSEKNLIELAGGGAKAPQAVVSAKLTVKQSASDEEVQQLIDLVNVVADELTQSQPDKAPFKLTLGKGFDNGQRVITVDATVLNAPKDPSKLVNHIAMLAGLKDQALFRRFMFGIEFGTDASEVFAPMPQRALADLFENFRLTANFEYDDAALKMLTVLSLQPDGLDEDSLAKLLGATFLARGARSVHAAANFRSYKEVVNTLIDSIAKIPLTTRPAKDDAELYKQAMASAVLRMRLEAVTSITQVRSTVFNAIPQLEMIYGDVPEPLVVQVLGLPSANKGAFIATLGVEPNGPYFAKQRVYFGKQPGKQHLMVVESDGPFANAVSNGIVVCVIDASSEEKLAESQRHVSVRITNSDSISPDEIIFVVANSKSGGAAVPFPEVERTLRKILDVEESENIFEFDGTAPSKLLAAIQEKLADAEDANDAAANGEEDDDDDEEGPNMAAIAKKAYKGASTCVAGLQDIKVTNSLVCVEVQALGLPFGNVLAETDPEKIRRNRIEFAYRFGNIMGFSEGVTDVSELAEAWAPAESEGGKQKSGGDSDDDAVQRRKQVELVEGGGSSSSD